MRIIALEEYIATPEVVATWRWLESRWQDVGFQHSSEGRVGAALLELGDGHIAAMDNSGVDVQVLAQRGHLPRLLIVASFGQREKVEKDGSYRLIVDSRPSKVP